MGSVCGATPVLALLSAGAPGLPPQLRVFTAWPSLRARLFFLHATPSSWLGQCPEIPTLLRSLAKPFPSTFHSLPTHPPPAPRSVPARCTGSLLAWAFRTRCWVSHSCALCSLVTWPTPGGCVHCAVCVIQPVPQCLSQGGGRFFFPAFLTGLLRVPGRDRCQQTQDAFPGAQGSWGRDGAEERWMPRTHLWPERQ